MKLTKKSFFTLLELLVVLFLLSIGSAVVGVNIKKLYKEQRFYAEADQILDHLEMAQDLMLILDTDVSVIFVEDNDHHLSYSLDVLKPLVVRASNLSDPLSFPPPDAALSMKWRALIEKKHDLQTIQGLNFLGEERVEMELNPKEDHRVLKKTRLRFSSTSMTKGKLILSVDKTSQGQEKMNKLSRTLTLTGYPCHMRSQQAAAKEENELEESKRLYPKLD